MGWMAGMKKKLRLRSVWVKRRSECACCSSLRARLFSSLGHFWWMTRFVSFYQVESFIFGGGEIARGRVSTPYSPPSPPALEVARRLPNPLGVQEKRPSTLLIGPLKRLTWPGRRRSNRVFTTNKPETGLRKDLTPLHRLRPGAVLRYSCTRNNLEPPACARTRSQYPNPQNLCHYPDRNGCGSPKPL